MNCIKKIKKYKKMISSATAIYETIQIPRPPDLRRSSRNPVIDTAYQTHENIKKYYKTRNIDINNVYISIFMNQMFYHNKMIYLVCTYLLHDHI